MYMLYVHEHYAYKGITTCIQDHKKHIIDGENETGER